MTATPKPEAESMDASASVRAAVAANLRRARLARGASLREVAAATGVSTALLSQIEREVANPTVSVLARLAAHFDVSFADLTRIRLGDPEVLRAAPGTGSAPRVRTLFDMLERRRFDISEGVLPPHQPGSFGAHGSGSIEHTYVVAGAVTLVIGERTWTLRAGDAVRFDSSVAHAYRTEDVGATVLTVVTFEDD